MSKVMKRGATSGLTRDNWDEDEITEEMGVFRKASESELKERPMRKARRRGEMSETVAESSVFKGFSLVSSASSTVSAPTFSFLNSSNKPALNPTFNFNSPTSSPLTNTKPAFNFKDSKSSPSTNDKPAFSFGLKDDKKKEESFVSTTNDVGSQSLTFTSFKSPPTELKLSSESNTFGKRKIISSPISERNEISDVNSDKTRELYLSNLKGLNVALLSWVKLHVEKSAYINMTPIFDDYKTHLDELKKKYNCNSDIEKSPVTKSPFSGNLSGSVISKSPASTLSSPLGTNGILSDKFSDKKETKTAQFSFGNKNPLLNSNDTTSSSYFSFGSSAKPAFTLGGSGTDQKDSSKSNGDKPAPFSFGLASGTTSFSFGAKDCTAETAKSTENDTTEDCSDEPPKVEVKEIKEDDAIYEKKCKLFYKKDDSYADRGVGTLYLKTAGEKTQLLIRALTNLGTILLNIVLNESLPTQRMGKNNVLIVCVPNPPINPKEAPSPISMLIRVKTSDDADELLEIIEKHKK